MRLHLFEFNDQSWMPNFLRDYETDYLEFITDKFDVYKDINPIFSRDEEWIVSDKGGVLHQKVTLGQKIEKNDILGAVKDPFGSEESESIKSHIKGVVVGINTSPLIQEGMPVFKIASFLDYEKAETVICEWDKKQPDSYMV